MSNAPNPSNVSEENTLRAVAAVSHPEFKEEGSWPIVYPDGGLGVIEDTNDVALILLEKAPAGPIMPLNRRPLADADLGTNVRLIGYGRTYPANDATGEKFTVEVPISEISQSLFWTGNKEWLSKGACSADSGGPALLGTPDGRQVIVGVIRGYHPAFPICSYNSMTRVDVFAGFVDSWLEQNDPIPQTKEGCGCGPQSSSGWLLILGIVLANVGRGRRCG